MLMLPPLWELAGHMCHRINGQASSLHLPISIVYRVGGNSNKRTTHKYSLTCRCWRIPTSSRLETGVHHPYGRDDTVILDNAAPVPPGDALPHACSSLCIHFAEPPYLWPYSRSIVPVACSIAVMPPDLGQQGTSPPGEADAERRPPSENGISRPTDINPPLPYLGTSVDTVETARTPSLTQGPAWGLGFNKCSV